MTADTQNPTTPFSLRRWSQRKLAAARKEDAPRPVDMPAGGELERAAATATSASIEARNAGAIANAVRDEAAPSSAAAPGGVPSTPAARPDAASAATSVGAALPSLESLTIDSDYSPFMQPGVDENVKRSALRKLLRHPRFNVMDGLDVYIDDYSLPSPIEPALVRTLMQARYIFNPPQTRVNAEGHVEDVPDEPAEAADAGAAPVPQVAEAADARLPGDEIAAAIVEAPAETSTPGDASNDAGLPNPAAAQTQTKAIRR
jgi:hypothetical protein